MADSDEVTQGIHGSSELVSHYGKRETVFTNEEVKR